MGLKTSKEGDCTTSLWATCSSMLFMTRFLLISTPNLRFQLPLCSHPPVIHHCEDPDSMSSITSLWISPVSSPGWTSPAPSASPHRASAAAPTILVASPKITPIYQCLSFCGGWGGARYWMPCCRCGLMSANQGGINLALIHWLCFCWRSPRCCWLSRLAQAPLATQDNTHLHHSSSSLIPLIFPPGPPRPLQQSRPSGSQAPACIADRAYLPLSVLVEFHHLSSRCMLKESYTGLWIRQTHPNQETRSHSPFCFWPFNSLGQITSPLSVFGLSSTKAFIGVFISLCGALLARFISNMWFLSPETKSMRTVRDSTQVFTCRVIYEQLFDK